jgi:hypothetical protein
LLLFSFLVTKNNNYLSAISFPILPFLNYINRDEIEQSQILANGLSSTVPNNPSINQLLAHIRDMSAIANDVDCTFTEQLGATFSALDAVSIINNILSNSIF